MKLLILLNFAIKERLKNCIGKFIDWKLVFPFTFTLDIYRKYSINKLSDKDVKDK